MKINYYKVHLKKWLYLTKQEQKGIYPLIIILLLLIVTPELYDVLYAREKNIRFLESIQVEVIEAGKELQKQNNVKLLQKDSVQKPKLIYPVNLNTADSTTIVALYRIGPGLTHKILEYREQLGGFVNLNQLTEIWGFDEDILFDLKGKITVSPFQVKRFKLNNVTLDQLQTHPYFKFKLSRIIINYRTQHGPYNSLQSLKEIPVVDDSVYKRITLYLE